MSDRLIDAIDEWFHRRGFGWVQADGKPATVVPWWGRFVKPLCDLRERRLIGKETWAEMNANTTASSNVFTNVQWRVRLPHKGRRS